MAQKKTTTSIRPDDDAAFLKTLQFRGFGLEQSSSHLNRYAFGAALADKQEFITEVNADYTVSLHDDDKFIVSGQFEVKQSLASKEQIVAISSMFTAPF